MTTTVGEGGKDVGLDEPRVEVNDGGKKGDVERRLQVENRSHCCGDLEVVTKHCQCVYT